MLLITPEYRDLNAELHERVPAYGTGGHKWAATVRQIARDNQAKSILDYGSGKGTLKESLRGLKVYEYDPAITGKDKLPASAGLVVCCDVMEHVEPECTEAVIKHICKLATRAVFVVVSCRTGGKRLADGRPAHINVQSPLWWHTAFNKFGRFEQAGSGPDEYIAIMRKASGRV